MVRQVRDALATAPQSVMTSLNAEFACVVVCVSEGAPFALVDDLTPMPVDPDHTSYVNPYCLTPPEATDRVNVCADADCTAQM
jgi:hypothetical protein